LPDNFLRFPLERFAHIAARTSTMCSLSCLSKLILPAKPRQKPAPIDPAIQKFVLHSMYYGNEVRDFNLVPKAQNVTVSEKEQELGIGLIVRLTFGGFRPRITKTNIAFEYWRR
jgi:hypothetical protein